MSNASLANTEDFGRRSYDAVLQQAQTEIAILKVHVSNLEDKVDDVKKELKQLREHLDHNAHEFNLLLKEFQRASTEAHKQMADKISSLEKWRWMMMGAGVVLGSLGFEAIKTLFVM